MITRFGVYESLNQGKPKVGDWVICKDDFSLQDEFQKFLANNIGRIVKINPRGLLEYQVKYSINEEIKKYFLNNTRNFTRVEIIYWSADREDLEVIISSKKYNL